MDFNVKALQRYPRRYPKQPYFARISLDLVRLVADFLDVFEFKTFSTSNRCIRQVYLNDYPYWRGKVWRYVQLRGFEHSFLLLSPDEIKNLTKNRLKEIDTAILIRYAEFMHLNDQVFHADKVHIAAYSISKHKFRHDRRCLVTCPMCMKKARFWWGIENINLCEACFDRLQQMGCVKAADYANKISQLLEGTPKPHFSIA